VGKLSVMRQRGWMRSEQGRIGKSTEDIPRGEAILKEAGPFEDLLGGLGYATVLEEAGLAPEGGLRVEENSSQSERGIWCEWGVLAWKGGESNVVPPSDATGSGFGGGKATRQTRENIGHILDVDLDSRCHVRVDEYGGEGREEEGASISKGKRVRYLPRGKL
jgi:hypothetical protein